MHPTALEAKAEPKAALRAGPHLPVCFSGHWDVVCRDKHGVEKWRDTIENIVVNEGLNHLLDVTLSGATQDTTWFVGLTSATPTVAAGNTLASHAGWTEVTAYDETNRVAWVDGGVSSQSVSNSGSPATFTINANGTDVGGAFLAGVNTGTSGVLYAAGAFTAGNKSLDDNDTLDVTFTATAAAA
jgi:hypothetical protein